MWETKGFDLCAKDLRLKSMPLRVPIVSSASEFEQCRPGSRVAGRLKLGQAWQPRAVGHVSGDETLDLTAAGMRGGRDSGDIFEGESKGLEEYLDIRDREGV